MIKGSNSIVYVRDTTLSAWRPLACITANSYSKTLSALESATKCNPSGTDYEADRLNRTVSIDGEIIDTTSVGGDTAKASWDYLDGLQDDSADNGTKQDFWYDTGIADQSRYFKALITELNHDAPATDKITFSATLQITGTTVNVDPFATT